MPNLLRNDIENALVISRLKEILKINKKNKLKNIWKRFLNKRLLSSLCFLLITFVILILVIFSLYNQLQIPIIFSVDATTLISILAIIFSMFSLIFNYVTIKELPINKIKLRNRGNNIYEIQFKITNLGHIRFTVKIAFFFIEYCDINSEKKGFFNFLGKNISEDINNLIKLIETHKMIECYILKPFEEAAGIFYAHQDETVETVFYQFPKSGIYKISFYSIASNFIEYWTSTYVLI